MASRLGRLTSQKDFDALKRRSNSGHAQLVTVRFHSAGTVVRLGIITSSRVSKKAVTRNLIRRRIRAIITELPRQSLRPGMLLVIARPKSGEASFTELQQQVLHALTRARALTTPAS